MAAHSSNEYLTSDEVARLQEGLPDLKTWSAHIFVPFQSTRLRNARVLWINRRWFAERLFDLNERYIYNRVTAWIIGEFAYIAPTANDDPNGLIAQDTRTLYADRYGSSSGLAYHGGSGRVSVTGRFQAKGIGQTPLVTPDAPSGHSHGCMSVAEAVSEAIFAELASAEFPHGALPTIAIIDTGLNFSSPDLEDEYDQNVRRAISIRPVVIRIAHIERAPLFKRSITGYENIQAIDSLRCREIVNAWMDCVRHEHQECMDTTIIKELLGSIAEQIAFGQVHRMFSGGYFSSNLTIRGALLDFGNMHALPNWSRAQVHNVAEGFGKEMPLLSGIVKSLTFYTAKYRNLPFDRQMELDIHEWLQVRYLAAWRKYSLALFQAGAFSESVKDSIHDFLWRYYLAQQRHRVRYRFGKIVTASSNGIPRWLFDGVVEGHHSTLATAEGETLRGIDRTLRESVSDKERMVAWYTAARLLKPRITLDRHRLLDDAAEIGGDARLSVAPGLIEDFIHRKIDEGRRYWPRFPDGYGVLAHASRGGSSALLLRGSHAQRVNLWIEGITGENGNLIIFDQLLSERDGAALGIQRYGRYWSVIADAKEENGQLCVETPGGKLRVPSMNVIYDPPASNWLS